MAAAALLRSVARRIARAPPLHTRPLVARGLHGCARSGAGGSLPPPTRNEIQMGNRLVAGMAAAGLPPLASKMARAPNRRLLQGCGLHTSTSPKQPGMPTAAKFAYVSLFATAGFLYFWVLPGVQELSDNVTDLLRENTILIKALDECQRTHTVELADSSQAQTMQALGHGKEPDGAIHK